MMTLEEEVRLFYKFTAILAEAGLDEPAAATGAANPEVNPSQPVASEPEVVDKAPPREMTPTDIAVMDLAKAHEAMQGSNDPRAKAAYQQAWNDAIVAMQPHILKRARAISPNDAEDVAQEILSKPSFLSGLIQRGQKLRDGDSSVNLMGFAARSVKNQGIDVARKQKRMKTAGGSTSDDDETPGVFTRTPDAGLTPDETVEKQGQVELAKKKYKERTGYDWTPEKDDEQPAQEPEAEPAQAEPAQEPVAQDPAQAEPAAAEAPAEEPAEEPTGEEPSAPPSGGTPPDEPPPAAGAAAVEAPAPAASRKRGKKASVELPPLTAEQHKELIQAFAQLPKNRGKPVPYNGGQWIHTGAGDTVLSDPEDIQHALSTHLIHPETGELHPEPQHHTAVHAAIGDELDKRKIARAGGVDKKKSGKGNATAKQIQGTINQYKEFVPVHLGLADPVDRMPNKAVPLSKLQQAHEKAAADAAADPSNPEKASFAKEAQAAFDAASKEHNDLKANMKQGRAEFFAQHGNEAAQQSLAKAKAKEKAGTAPAKGDLPHLQRQVNAATSAAQAHPEDPAKQKDLQAKTAEFDKAHAARDAGEGAAQPEPDEDQQEIEKTARILRSRPMGVGVTAKKTRSGHKVGASFAADEKQLRLQTNDPEARVEPLDPDYEAERAKKFTRSPMLSKGEPRRPGSGEERQAHHVAQDIADAEHEYAALPDDEKGALHPTGATLAQKIGKLAKEYKTHRPHLGNEATSVKPGANLTRSASKLKSMKAPEVPDENAEPASPEVDMASHGVGPTESRSLAGLIFNESLQETYRIVSERMARFLTKR